MANVKINTDAAVNAARNIKTYNKQMQDGLSNVISAINRLDNSWDGSAATAAMHKFNEFKSRFPDARYNVLNNYVNFLLQQVGEGYTQTEDTNVSLADQFK